MTLVAEGKGGILVSIDELQAGEQWLFTATVYRGSDSKPS